MRSIKKKTILLTAVLSLSTLYVPQSVAQEKQVTLAISSAIESLDPYNTNSSINRSVSKSVYEGLFEFNQELKIQKVLAEDYAVSEDGLVYTIKLRQGVKFHDGTDFNSNAVKVTFDRVMDKSNGLSRWSQFKLIKEVRTVDDHTVEFVLEKPFSAFLSTLAHAAAMIMSPAALETHGNKNIAFNPVGTGPFKFQEWRPSEHVKVEKFDQYWRKGYPKVDSLVFRFVTDNNTRSSVIQTGEAQFAYPIPYEQAKLLEKAPNIEIVAAPSVADTYVAFNTQVAPFNDVRVRHALNYAINKEALAKVAYSGYARPMEGVIPQGVQYAQKMAPWPYDPAKARALLKEAGIADGLTVPLLSGYNDGTATKVVQFLQQQLAQVGVKTSIEILEAGQRIARVKQVAKPEDAGNRLYYIGWGSSTGEADWVLRPLLATSSWVPAFENNAYYSNALVDNAIESALVITDDAKKTELYKEAQEQIWKDAPWIFLVTREQVYGKSANLKGMYVMPDGNFYYPEIELQ